MKQVNKKQKNIDLRVNDPPKVGRCLMCSGYI